NPAYFHSLRAIQLGGNGIASRACVEWLQGRFGSGLSFGYLREADYLYPFQAEGYDYWRAGLGKALTQVLLFAGYDNLETLVFDFEGNQIESQLSEPIDADCNEQLKEQARQ